MVAKISSSGVVLVLIHLANSTCKDKSNGNHGMIWRILKADKKTCIYFRFKASPHSILILSRQQTNVARFVLHLIRENKRTM